MPSASGNSSGRVSFRMPSENRTCLDPSALPLFQVSLSVTMSTQQTGNGVAEATKTANEPRTTSKVVNASPTKVTPTLTVEGSPFKAETEEGSTSSVKLQQAASKSPKYHTIASATSFKPSTATAPVLSWDVTPGPSPIPIDYSSFKMRKRSNVRQPPLLQYSYDRTNTEASSSKLNSTPQYAVSTAASRPRDRPSQQGAPSTKVPAKVPAKETKDIPPSHSATRPSLYAATRSIYSKNDSKISTKSRSKLATKGEEDLTTSKSEVALSTDDRKSSSAPQSKPSTSAYVVECESVRAEIQGVEVEHKPETPAIESQVKDASTTSLLATSTMEVSQTVQHPEEQPTSKATTSKKALVSKKRQRASEPDPESSSEEEDGPVFAKGKFVSIESPMMKKLRLEAEAKEDKPRHVNKRQKLEKPLQKKKPRSGRAGSGAKWFLR